MTYAGGVNCYLTQEDTFTLSNHPDLYRGVNCYLTQVDTYTLSNHPDLYREGHVLHNTVGYLYA